MKIPYEWTRDYFNELLDTCGIEYSCKEHHGGFQWHFPQFPNGDIICCNGSYKADDGYVESYGFAWDDGDVTTLPPEHMIAYLMGIETEPISTYTTEDLFKSLNELFS